VLAAIRREAAPDALFVAGDLVLFGPRPAEALTLLRSLNGARFVMGNTDQYLLDNGGEQEVAFVRGSGTTASTSIRLLYCLWSIGCSAGEFGHSSSIVPDGP
jgi:hypothetical protein